MKTRKTKKSKRGGKRPGSGRKPTGPKTTTVAFRYSLATISALKDEYGSRDLNRKVQGFLEELHADLLKNKEQEAQTLTSLPG